MAETTRPTPQQQPAVAPAGPQDAKRQEEERQTREEAHQRSVEALSSPEQPTPTQEEADAIKEGALGQEPPPPEGTPVAGETEAQRRTRTEREARERAERERQQRDVKPDTTRSGYQTR